MTVFIYTVFIYSIRAESQTHNWNPVATQKTFEKLPKVPFVFFIFQ